VISNATKATRHRKALTLGLSISVTAHVAALAIVTVPGAGPGDSDAPRAEVVNDEFEALQVVQLATTAPSDPVQAPRPTATSQGAVVSTPAPADAMASIESLLADLAPAQMSVDVPTQGRPVVTFRDLEPVGQTGALMAAIAYGGMFGDGEEEDGGGLGGLLSSIGAALSGGGHCPTPAAGAGPLILR
jgi:hypothetical protein